MRMFRAVCLLFLLILLFVSCDETTLHQTMHDLTATDPYAGMVLIPAGEVTVGLSQKQLDRYKQQYPPTIPVTLETFTTSKNAYYPPKALPMQTVHVNAFYMDVHEVTWGQYLEFMDASGYESKSVLTKIHDWGWKIDSEFRKLPIEQLTIADMKAYAEWHGKQIPTEIEWEKAARGGLADNSYPWGNEITPAHANYNHAGILNAFDANYKPLLSPVEGGRYPPNGYGLYDMAGNVSEYVATEWDNNPTRVSSVVARGGNYRRPGYEQQNWYRNYYSTGLGIGHVGFRCIKRIN